MFSLITLQCDECVVLILTICNQAPFRGSNCKASSFAGESLLVVELGENEGLFADSIVTLGRKVKGLSFAVPNCSTPKDLRENFEPAVPITMPGDAFRINVQLLPGSADSIGPVVEAGQSIKRLD